jgi:hypothetical protein
MAFPAILLIEVVVNVNLKSILEIQNYASIERKIL